MFVFSLQSHYILVSPLNTSGNKHPSSVLDVPNYWRMEAIIIIVNAVYECAYVVVLMRMNRNQHLGIRSKPSFKKKIKTLNSLIKEHISYKALKSLFF